MMKALRRLFSTQSHLRTLASAGQYQGMAADSKQKLNINIRYQMNSGYEIPVLGFGVNAHFRCLDLFHPFARFHTSWLYQVQGWHQNR
jgi:hypothetical protein